MTDASGKPYGYNGHGSLASMNTTATTITSLSTESSIAARSPLRSSLKKPRPRDDGSAGMGFHNPGTYDSYINYIIKCLCMYTYHKNEIFLKFLLLKYLAKGRGIKLLIFSVYSYLIISISFFSGFSGHSPTLSRNGSQKKVRIQTHSTEV